MFGIKIGKLGSTSKTGSLIPGPRDIYFNPVSGDSWNTIANWFLDPTYTVPAGRVPIDNDSVYINDTIYGTGPSSWVNLTLFDGKLPDASGNGSSNISIAANGNLAVREGYFEGFLNSNVGVAFYGTSTNNAALDGNVSFNDSSRNIGTVIQNANFYGNSECSSGGNVSGLASFFGSSINYSTVYFCDFYETAGNSGTTGLANFYNSSYNNGTCLDVTATFYNSSSNSGQCNAGAVFNDESNNAISGTVFPSAIFYGTSQNNGSVNGDATFNDDSSNNGTVSGIVTCNTTGICP